jgi:homoserine kinase
MRPTADLIEALRGAGHAAVVSGAGPSVLVLGGSAGLAELDDFVPVGWQRMDLPVDIEGMQVSAGR